MSDFVQNPVQDALELSVIINRRDTPGQIAWTEWRVGAAFGCPADPYSVVLTGATGKIDPCLLPTTSGLLIEVAGVPVTDQSTLNFIAQTGIAISFGPAGELYIANTGASSTSFADITSGTNIQAAMVVGSGASITLQCPGTGVIEATELATSTCTPVVTNLSAPTHAGQLLISQPGNASAIWADPQVQGLYPAGSNIASPPPYTPPTTIEPVLVGGAGQDGLLHNLPLNDAGSAVIVVDQGESDSVSHFAWDTGPVFISYPVTLAPVISVRAQVAATTISFHLTGFDLYAAPTMVRWVLYKNAILGGGTAWTNVPSSNAQEDVSSTTITGGIQVDSGYSVLGTRINQYSLLFAIPGGVPDIYTLAIQGDVNGHGTKAVAALRWTEQ